jgi:hypothetical protein
MHHPLPAGRIEEANIIATRQYSIMPSPESRLMHDEPKVMTRVPRFYIGKIRPAGYSRYAGR